MARKIVVFALLLFAVVGLASAAATAPAASPSEGDASSGAVGNIGGVETDAAPVGGPVPDGTFSSIPGATAPSPASGAAAVEVSAVAGVATAAAAVAAVFF